MLLASHVTGIVRFGSPSPGNQESSMFRLLHSTMKLRQGIEQGPELAGASQSEIFVVFTVLLPDFWPIMSYVYTLLLSIFTCEIMIINSLSHRVIGLNSVMDIALAMEAD